MKKSEISHYYVDNNLFNDYMDAIEYCDQEKISYDKIVKTKNYLKTKENK